jgi:hypothetical protein
MEQFELYFKRSAECLEAARRAKDDAVRLSFLEMASKWHELAEKCRSVQQRETYETGRRPIASLGNI